MPINCQYADERQMLVGQSLGIGLAIGLVCGGILVSIFFIVYRSSYIQNLIAERIAKKKEPMLTESKNKSMVTAHTSGEPREETQPYLTRPDVNRDEKKKHEKIGIRNKRQQQEEEVTNVFQTDHQNAGFSSHGPYDDNCDQPIYANTIQMSTNESEYDYVAPCTIQGWYPVESQSSDGYVHMKSPHHNQW